MRDCPLVFPHSSLLPPLQKGSVSPSVSLTVCPETQVSLCIPLPLDEQCSARSLRKSLPGDDSLSILAAIPELVPQGSWGRTCWQRRAQQTTGHGHHGAGSSPLGSPSSSHTPVHQGDSGTAVMASRTRPVAGVPFVLQQSEGAGCGPEDRCQEAEVGH